MADITWHDRSDGAPRPTEAQIAAVEEAYGVSFPTDYREVLKAHGGQSPDKQILETDDDFGALFMMLLSVADLEEGVRASFAFQQDRLDDWAHGHALSGKFLPIAIGGGQGIYCYDLRDGGTPSGIVYVDLDSTPDDSAAATPVAPTFEALLEHLEE